MKILITGATGFVGSHLSDLLHSEGHEIYSLVRDPTKAKTFQVKGTLISGALGPSNRNEWISELPKDLDAVVHAAGIVHSFNKRSFFAINTESSRQLMDDLASRYTKLKFVMISSLAAAGPDAKFQTENEHPSPVSDYGRSKLIAENVLTNEAPATWQKVIIRPPMVIGPRDPAILDIFKMVQKGFMPALGFKSTKRLYSFIGVFDLIETIKLSLEKEIDDTEIFYSAHPSAVKLGELVKTIAAKMGKSSPIVIPLPVTPVKMVTKLLAFKEPSNIRLTPDKIYEMTPMAWTCSGQKATDALGQSYKWDLEKIIEATLKDYKSRGWL